jgi:hypothetical protein
VMFFMARDYHSFTVSVRVATTRVEEHARDNSGSSGRLSPLPICPTPRLDFSLRRGLAPAIAKATTGGAAMSLARRAADAMDLGPVPGPGPSPGIRSTFAPPDVRPCGTGRNGRGRQVTAEAGDRLSMHVTAVVRDQAGMAGDSRGAGGATCKIAGIAYTGSNPVPATTTLTCGNAAAGCISTPA